MAFITFSEIIAIIVMTFGIGFIFTRYYKREPREGYDPLTYYTKSNLWENIKYGAIVAAPAVVLHELAHKFAAMGFGAQATLHAPYTIYALVILLSLMNFPVLFFVGGYVSHTALPAFASAIVAAAGPLTNMVLWLTFRTLVRYKVVHRKYYKDFGVMAKINMFLFIFNMLPIPGFDGYKFFTSLFSFFL